MCVYTLTTTLPHPSCLHGCSVAMLNVIFDLTAWWTSSTAASFNIQNTKHTPKLCDATINPYAYRPKQPDNRRIWDETVHGNPFVIPVNIRINPGHRLSQRQILYRTQLYLVVCSSLFQFLFDSISFCSSFVIYQLLVMVSKQSPTLCTRNQHYYAPTLLIKTFNDDYGWILN